MRRGLMDYVPENTHFKIHYIRVRPHFRFGNSNLKRKFRFDWKRNKAWFHMIHFDAKHQKSEAKTKVKLAKIKQKNRSETKIKQKNW
jgi:hypothetical protein